MKTSGLQLEVLVVEDDALVREVIIGNLAEKFPSFRFRAAASGNAALALINEHVPDLILADLRMPGLNGFALTRLLRSRDRTRHIPIIIVSALKDSTSVLKAMELGASDYCVKPIDFLLLSRKIEHICAPLLRGEKIPIRNRSTARKKILCPVTCQMQVEFPEKEGIWVNSPFEHDEGEPLLFEGSRFFKALRLSPDSNYWWSRVEHCRKEEDAFHMKLLFDPVPEHYGEQVSVLGKARDRLQRYFGSGREPLAVDFPCVVRDVSGSGLRLSGSLPWRTGSQVYLNLDDLVSRLGLQASSTKVSGRIQWSRRDKGSCTAGFQFEEVEEDLRLQIMSYCLGGPALKSVIGT